MYVKKEVLVMFSWMLRLAEYEIVQSGILAVDICCLGSVLDE